MGSDCLIMQYFLFWITDQTNISWETKEKKEKWINLMFVFGIVAYGGTLLRVINSNFISIEVLEIFSHFNQIKLNWLNEVFGLVRFWGILWRSVKLFRIFDSSIAFDSSSKKFFHQILLSKNEQPIELTLLTHKTTN